jgi:predicted permease
MPERSEHRTGIRRFLRLRPQTAEAIHADADEELDALVTARIEYLEARGYSHEAARAEALRRVGAELTCARRQVHESAEHRERRMRLREYMDGIAQDLRYAARGLLRRPGFTAVAALTLAIGIGATTAVFSAVHVLLLRPLPYDRPDELMQVSLTVPASEAGPAIEDMVWSYPKYRVFRDAQQLFSSAALYSFYQTTVTRDEVEQLPMEFVGATYLRTLGLTPQRGRDFDVAVDAQPGAEREVLISDALWQRRYNADPEVTGRTIELDRLPYTIIGVAPAGFHGLTGRAELFIPIMTRPAEDLSEVLSHEFYLVARRKPGIDAAVASAGVAVISARLRAAFPGTTMGGRDRESTGWGVSARPLNGERVAPIIKRSLLVLFGAVAFVLLIACTNVANLLLSRASVRRREIAVRLAIGASRARLMRLLITESLLLALIGGGAGAFLAWAGARKLSAIDPAVTLRMGGNRGLGAITFDAIQLDWVTLGFGFALTLVVGLAFAIVPAWNLTRASLSAAMKEAPARQQGSGSGSRRVLVIAEVAMAMVLLAGSGLMIRSLAKLLAIDPGFDGRPVLTVRLTVPGGSLARDSLPSFYVQLLERLRAVPGVQDVAIGNCPPLNGGCNLTIMEFMDRPGTERGPSVSVQWASPTWFSTMGVPLLRGRMFTDADRQGAPKVVLVNETAASRFWPNENPIGKRVGVGQGGFGDGAEIVGIVRDVRQHMDSLPRPDVYIPYYQSPRASMMIFLRTGGNPAQLAPAVRAALREVAPHFPAYDLKPMRERAASATARARFSAVLLGLFGAIALALAIIGVYGVMSLAVAARTREIGIRVALGADRGKVERLVIGEGLVMVSIGALLGLSGALVGTRLLRTLLYDLTPWDPATYAATFVVLGLAALFASWAPARRAARLDPTRALRAE